MFRFGLTLCLVGLAGPVRALSCMAPDVVRQYQHISRDETDYILVKGKVALSEAPNAPAKPSGMKPTEAFTSARATGRALSASGFDVPFDQPITIRATCLAAWCGSPEGLSEDTHFLALRIEGEDLILDRDPCGGLVVRWSRQEERRLLDCHLKGKCELKEF